MERKDFLKNGMAALGITFVAPLLKACTKETVAATDTITGTTTELY
ncbi:MAG: hypothetical protein WKG06_23545 [Segetibacter sp.]